MDGGVVGPGPASLQDSLPRSGVAADSKPGVRAHAAFAGSDEDQIANSLLNLANSEIGELLDRLDQARSMADPALFERLLDSAAAAASLRDMPAAAAAIGDMVALDPERGVQLAREAASLAPIRGDVNDLLDHLAFTAKSDAERTLAAAAHASRSAERVPGFVPEMLALGQRFIETGQHVNYVRAAELGQAILTYFDVPVVEAGAAPARRAPHPQPSVLRAPVLLLLIGGVLLVLLVVFRFLSTSRP